MRNTYCFTVLFVGLILTPAHSWTMLAPARLLTRAVAAPVYVHNTLRWNSSEENIAHIIYRCADLQKELRYVRWLAQERDCLTTEIPFLEDICKLSHYFEQEKNDTLATKIKTYKRHIRECNQQIAVRLRVYVNPTIETLEKTSNGHRDSFSLRCDLNALITSIKQERLDLIEATIKTSKNNS